MTVRAFFAGLVVLFLLVLVSCGKDSSPREILSGVSRSEIVLKFSDGYRKINISELQSMTISIKPALPSTEPPLVKTFSGEKMTGILSALGLHKPTEPGAVSALISGTILLQFSSRSLSSRTLNILNSRLIEDVSFNEAYYNPSNVLGKSWLEKQ